MSTNPTAAGKSGAPIATPAAIPLATPAVAATPAPASQLLGHTLTSGWQLVQQLARPPGGTGSNFGTGYIAERGAERAFVKALDFVAALRAADPVLELQRLTSLAIFEREAMELCGAKKLSRLVKLIHHEYTSIHGQQVYCLLMEIGVGDLRRQLSTVGTFPASVILSILGDVSLGIGQLHRHGVAHQDIKPSNVLSMTDMSVSSKNVFKVADLGRVVHKAKAGPYDALKWPGDRHYQPPERWYGYVPRDWTDAREASDAYMLGSLAFFLFTGVPLQPLLTARIPPPLMPGAWTGGYVEALTQVLRSLQFSIITDTLVPILTDSVKDGVVEAVKELIDPDPTKRGDRNARKRVGSPVELERFHQRFKGLATRAAIYERMNRP